MIMSMTAYPIISVENMDGMIMFYLQSRCRQVVTDMGARYRFGLKKFMDFLSPLLWLPSLFSVNMSLESRTS